MPPDEKKSCQEPTQGNELSFTESEVNVLGGYGLNLADVCSPQSHTSTEDTKSEEKVTEAELRILNDFGVELPASQKDEMECSDDSQLSENSQSTGKSIKTVTKHVESQNEAIEEVADPSLCVVSNKIGIVQIFFFIFQVFRNVVLVLNGQLSWTVKATATVPSTVRKKIGSYAVTEMLEILDPGQVTTSDRILPWSDIIQQMAQEFQPSPAVNEPEDYSLPSNDQFSTGGES